jgi:hypothetical protein
MSSSGTIPLQAIWAMLDHCAPGHTRLARVHNWVITFGKKCYPSLPLGPHGARKNPSIQVGHVRKMCRALDILDCAKTQIELLK